MSTADQVRSYILENFLFTDDGSVLKNGDSLLGKGIIDSTGALELTNFLESQFGVKVEDHEIVPENLDSVDNILAFIARKHVADV